MTATKDAPVSTPDGVVAPKLSSLTGLRFIAAFLVFLNHVAALGIFADPGVQSGYSFVFANSGPFGVAFFFVLSGFVLTWSVKPGDTTGRFWRRRFFKIVPNHVVVFAASLLLFVLSGTPVMVAQAVANLFLVHAWTADMTYMLGQLNGVSWSLSVELVFYLLFPLLIVLVRRIKVDNLWRWAIGVGALVTLMPALAQPFLPEQPQFVFPVMSWPELWFLNWGPPARVLEFVFGMLLARIVQNGRWIKLPVLPAALLAVGCYVVALYLPVAWTFAALYTVPLGLLIAAVATRDVQGRRGWLSSRPMVFLGEISFAFFLVHFNLLFALHGAFGGKLVVPGVMYEIHSWGVFGALLFMAGAALAAITVSWLLYTLVERPIMRRWSRPRTSVTR
jgi:peptidoglycan/LPS O-acetylase OafA/YrhL